MQYYDQPDGRGPLPSCPILAGERRLSQANAGPSVLAMGRPMGYGAFEMAARYSTINLNDRFTPRRRALAPEQRGWRRPTDGRCRRAELVSEFQCPIPV